jgi:hypothetical protein
MVHSNLSIDDFVTFSFNLRVSVFFGRIFQALISRTHQWHAVTDEASNTISGHKI